MLEIEIDGKALQVAAGSTVIEAAHQAGTYIPHFCYHKKLSIAASCRMCLVQIEKMPKPMPACATPVTNGMKVFTHSEMAIKAQQGVMEFLLINHPLDCPICDQGGECQLQDLAVGYGSTQSKYQEEKRVVPNKNFGPLVATDMTRCINCTRCVRFTQEIAGLMELGQAFRGERAEIMSFVESTVDSELSGNLIDLCPVGALTSLPFRYSARTWELSRRKSISPHDSLGANLIVQTRHDRAMRVLPYENEGLNECWLADKERFSYEGLNSAERLTRPMVKQGGTWREVDWNVALDYASHALRDVVKNHGAAALGGLLSPHATLEELYLAQKLLRGLGCENIDTRLRQVAPTAPTGTPWLGMRVAELSQLDRVLVVGSFLRKDHPLLAQRLRQSAKRGAQISLLHSGADDDLIKLTARATVAPSQLVATLAQVLKAVCEIKSVAVDAELASLVVGETAKVIAQSLASGANVGVLLGNFAQQHVDAAALHALAQRLAQVLQGRIGFIGEAANSVGAHTARALPGKSGLTASEMGAQPRQAYVLLGVEPELDCAHGAQALAAVAQAASVIVLSPFKSQAALDYADVLLPISPFTETSGTFINTEGRVQSFYAVVKPLAETRPAWKVLRVLGNLLGLSGFEFSSSEEVRAEALAGRLEASAELPNALGFVSGLSNATETQYSAALTRSVGAPAGKFERVADVPTNFADPLVRRAPALQQTRDSQSPCAYLNAASLARVGVGQGEQVKVGAGGTDAVVLSAELDAGLPDGVVRIAAGHALTVKLGAMSAVLTVEKT